MLRSITLVVVSLSLIAPCAYADEEAQVLANNSYFHVAVVGLDSHGNRVERAGKAFAIAPDILITARHVIGDVTDWWNAGSPGGVVRPVRKVALHWMDRPVGTRGLQRSHSDLYTTSFSPGTIDASKLTIVRMGTDDIRPLQLSTNGVDPSAKYRVLLVNDAPKSPDSIRLPFLLELELAPYYASSEFGGMYAFHSSGGREIVPGDSGSPVLNEHDEVVGFVSGVADGTVLVTMASSFASYIPEVIDSRFAHLKRVNDVLNSRFDEVEGELNTKVSALVDRVDAVGNASNRVEAGKIKRGHEKNPKFRDREREEHTIVEGRVDFETPFDSVPEVIVSLSGFNASDGAAIFAFRVRHSDKMGFDWEFSVQGGTDLLWFEGGWMAVGQ